MAINQELIQQLCEILEKYPNFGNLRSDVNKLMTTMASTTENGLMTTEYVEKLNGISEGANKTVTDGALSSTSTNPIENKVVNEAIDDLKNKIATVDTETTNFAKTMLGTIEISYSNTTEDVDSVNVKKHKNTYTFTLLRGNGGVADTFDISDIYYEYSNASEAKGGLISPEDQKKLNSISEGANEYILPEASSTLGGVKTTSEVTDIRDYTPVPIVNGIPYYPNSLPASDVYEWAKSETKPTYNSSEVGADPSGSADEALASAKLYTNTEIAKLIDSAPETMDTLNELANAIASNTGVIESINALMANKAEASDLIAHLNDTDNPHNVTKSQLGLGDVENKTSEMIRAELTKENVTSALGYTPTSSVSFTQSLLDGTEVGILSIDGTDVTLYAPTNTHYTTRLIIGASETATDNAQATNGNVYMNVLDNTTVRNTHKIIGANGITVESDVDGHITITGTTYNIMTGATASEAGKAGLVPMPEEGKNIAFLRGDGTWAVPINTTYTPGTGLVLSGTTINHSNSIVAGTINGNESKILSFDDTFNIPIITYDAEGHITGTGITTMTMPSNPNTDTKVTNTLNTTVKAYITGTILDTTNTGTQVFDTGVYLDTTAGMLTATSFNGDLLGNADTATKATQDSTGQQIDATYIKDLSISGKVITITRGDDSKFTQTTQDTDTTYTTMVGATASEAGKYGLVPTPEAGDQSKYLRGDGTWQTVTNYIHPIVSGYKHIPSGGSIGQTLRWTSDGTAIWQNEFVIGTQTEVTNEFTGEMSGISELYDGLSIRYYLPYATNGNAVTLTITFTDTGAQTDAIPVYRNSASALTDQLNNCVGSILYLTYVSAANRWIMSAQYDYDTYDRLRHSGDIKCNATTAITAKELIVASDGLYYPLKTGIAFDITQPILFAEVNIAVNDTSRWTYVSTYASITETQTITLTEFKPVYIKGTLSGSLFTPISNEPITQTIPTTDDGYQFILLGNAYDTTNLYLLPEHPIFQYKNGKFQLYGGSGGSQIDILTEDPVNPPNGYMWIVKNS